MRVGIGYDVHGLVQGRRLVLGGVEIQHPVGLLGHSDADVLCHAVADALLGAAALGDIGHLFPPDDPRFEDADSLSLLAIVGTVVSEHGWRVANVDATVVAERPRLAPHIMAMRTNMSQALALEVGQVCVKASTNEHLGFVGREEGIAAYAVALLEP